MHGSTRIISLDCVPGMASAILKDLHHRHGHIVLPEQPHMHHAPHDRHEWSEGSSGDVADVSTTMRHCLMALLERIHHLTRVVEASKDDGGALITVVIPNFLYALPIDDLQEHRGTHDIVAKMLKRHTRTLLRRHGLEHCWFVRIVLRFDPNECFDTLLSDMTHLNIADIVAFQDHLQSKVLPKATVIDVPRDTCSVDACLHLCSDTIAQTMA